MIKINAAGGIVINAENKVLMIFRLGYWDFPKGKVEVGEELDHAGIREVQEETGLHDVTIVRFISTMEHQYQMHGNNYHKTTYWYLMKTSENSVTPQIEEDITEVKWVSKNEVDDYLMESYQNLRDLWKIAKTDI